MLHGITYRDDTNELVYVTETDTGNRVVAAERVGLGEQTKSLG